MVAGGCHPVRAQSRSRPQRSALDAVRVDIFIKRAAIRIRCTMPDTADVAHHPFQAEIDELVACILDGRETSLSVFDAQKSMEVCLAADRSAGLRGQPVALPLIVD